MAPLVGIMNDKIGAYDKPVSIRQVLKDNKVDMSWMDWLAWSPAACKELKHLCTRVTKKKRESKNKQTQGQQVQNPFQSTFRPS